MVLGSKVNKNICSLYISNSVSGSEIAESDCEKNDDFDFYLSQSTAKLPSFDNCRNLQFGTIDSGSFMLMSHIDSGLTISFSKNSRNWSRPSKITDGFFASREFEKQTKTAVIVSSFQIDGHYIMFLGGDRIRVAKSDNAKKWHAVGEVKFMATASDRERIEVDLTERLETGILLCYRRVTLVGDFERHQVHIALLDLHDPTLVRWHSPTPVWQNNEDWGATSFGGAVVFRAEIDSFWNTSEFGIVRVRYPIEGIPFQMPADHAIRLEKSEMNPVLHPRGDFSWESFATYNPAAFTADGRIHILYRAQGDNLISSIGYATSNDGVTIAHRAATPIFEAQEVFETFQRETPAAVEQKYISGGGISGCEDPRVTVIDDRVYMTYVAFDGASPPRVALTSILLEDFLAERWLWQKPVLISPPGIVDKSAVIFPEKIDGQYVIMHRIFPDILIDFVSDLDFDGSHWLEAKHRIEPRPNTWDSRKVGAGAPPIKTPDGWLLIYYGVDDRDDRLYKMGAMLLDLNDPSKVLYRSSTPILEPNDWYENSGFKPGIVYPCGAVILGEKLVVYYGGADCVVCVASRNLADFLRDLKSHSQLKLESQRSIKIGPHATDT